jgi:hypothetical protein
MVDTLDSYSYILIAICGDFTFNYAVLIFDLYNALEEKIIFLIATVV